MVGGNKNVFNRRKLVLLAASDCRTIHRHQGRRGIYVQDHQWQNDLFKARRSAVSNIRVQ